MHEVRISIDADHLDADTFAETVSTFVRLLKTVERHRRGPRGVTWRLSTLRYASPAEVGFTGSPHKRVSPERPLEIGRVLLTGFRSLEGARRPEEFDDDTLLLAKEIARSRRGVHSISVLAGEEVQKITARTVVTVDELIGPRYEALGAVRGKLELISSHNGIHCNIYDDISGKAVKCTVPEVLKNAVISAFDRRVLASGTLRRDASGIPRTMDLAHVEPLREGEALPQSLLGLAPEITDGMDVVEYLKKRW